MYYEKFISSSILLLSLLLAAHAQLPELSAPKVLPESPAAAALTKYIECPVDLSNGLVQISIPLYEIVEGDIRIPLTLSFHASGLRPNMRSSCWLGDGWSLSTGPSLSRSIAGGADEYFYNSTIAETASPTWYQLSQVTSQAADVTLDEYHYSLLGSAGRMYILAYTYSGSRIASIANSGTLGGGGSYSHDANGNVTHDGLAGLDLQYNLLNLTKRISSGGTTLADYHYLADGTRAAAERGDGTGVQYRGSLIYTKEADGSLELDCALTSGGRIANDAGTLQVQHFIRDHLGSVRTVVDGSTGDVLETSDYLPFGKRWELTGGQSSQTVTDPTNRWRFSGKETQSFYNPAIPYNDFGARLHDPRTGRWLGVDPLAEKNMNMSFYIYCGNLPIIIVDKYGKDGVKYFDDEGNKIIETNLVILLAPKISANENASEKEKARIERKNARIERNNQKILDDAERILDSYYNGDIGGRSIQMGTLCTSILM